MKVGVWCAYGKTLSVSDGIGVFAHSLAKYLARSPRVNGVVMAIHAGDESQMEATVAAGGGCIRTVSLKRLPPASRWRRKTLRWRHRSQSRRYESLGRSGGMGGVARSERLRARLAATELATDRLLAKQAASDPGVFASPAEGGCDIWVLPHVSVERSFNAATVVLIHDMVPLREPGLLKPHDVASFRRRSQVVAERSTLIGCMSEVIRDGDIVGLLGCPAEKVRIVGAAVPDDIGFPDLPVPTTCRQQPDLPAGVAAPYLLYPAAFRGYKNHELLIEALSILDQLGVPPLQLVFTGDTPLPSHLHERAEAAGLSQRVLAVGRVDRDMLERLYRAAAATVVPSRHEQGSFPVLEALACGCPVAVSDIPSLREAFGPLNDTIPFFDPGSAKACAEAVASLVNNAEAVRLSQAEGFQRLRGRTWQQATDEWIDVFDEAIAMHAALHSRTSQPEKAVPTTPG